MPGSEWHKKNAKAMLGCIDMRVNVSHKLGAPA